MLLVCWDLTGLSELVAVLPRPDVRELLLELFLSCVPKHELIDKISLVDVRQDVLLVKNGQANDGFLDLGMLFHLQDGVDQVVADLKGQEIHEKAIGVVCVSQQHILRQ